MIKTFLLRSFTRSLYISLEVHFSSKTIPKNLKHLSSRTRKLVQHEQPNKGNDATLVLATRSPSKNTIIDNMTL